MFVPVVVAFAVDCVFVVVVARVLVAPCVLAGACAPVPVGVGLRVLMIVDVLPQAASPMAAKPAAIVAVGRVIARLG